MDALTVFNSTIIGLSTTWWVPYALKQHDAQVKRGIMLSIFLLMLFGNISHQIAHPSDVSLIVKIPFTIFTALIPIIGGYVFYRITKK
jgi:hypothetical protein